ncbi:flagellar M-ring protein FliF [Rhodocaloribacter litoris]|uniref:flagellar basal-body MS-ring/collar protein FliF n=1 Tax=Rhodocaloribacter litoris TaxID=2558931 RepID=UPI001423C360|nr:flagellar basal-body MS-ring/collar protein FliF [Rhodocaloribacter litoris]QXD16040.1 flagellar M-ring protein FliF [Rhodocaloribacter litoris]GIV59768.1 MAG: flagellar M-ring protein FliF [Rhodothermaceae bacterium]
MNNFFEQIADFLGRLPLRQKLALGLVVLGSIAVLAGVAYWANRPTYGLLFSNLEATEAGRVVEALNEQGVKYELKNGGTAIYVPQDQVYALRLHLMGEGVISDGPLGDKIFDQGTLGMTNFMQKVNLRRALEGELARTIASLSQVEMARVHLVLPEKRPFAQAQSPPTASVVLHLAGGARLTETQIMGITALVAGAVEGMTPDEVTLLDTRGNLLSNPHKGDPNVILTATQLQMQRDVEAHLTAKGQSMLDQVLGQGNAIVRVSATLDFTRSVVESKNIDPESATVISEERLEENSEANTANSSVRNYEVSERRERSEKSAGEISYLTVSVILNQKKRPAADAPETEPRPYAPEELTEIENLVKNAVGFKAERGDRFAIHQTVFDTSVDERLNEEVQAYERNQQLQLYLRYGLMALAIVLALWLLRSASRRATSLTTPEPKQVATGPASRALEPGQAPQQLSEGDTPSERRLAAPQEEPDINVDDIYASKLSAEAKARLKAKHKMLDEIKNQIKKNPEETAELIRSWLAMDMEQQAEVPG